MTPPDALATPTASTPDDARGDGRGRGGSAARARPSSSRSMLASRRAAPRAAALAPSSRPTASAPQQYDDSGIIYYVRLTC